jgi:hypothetical protein
VEQSVERELTKASELLSASATLSTTNPTFSYPGWKPGRRGGKPVRKRMRCGTASVASGSYLVGHFCWFLVLFSLQLWRWRLYVSPKCSAVYGLRDVRA